MGYTLVFRAMAFDDFREHVAANPVVAAFRDAGGGEPTQQVADTVASAALNMGVEVGSTGHSVAGGEWFREEIFEGLLGGLLGTELADHLLSRALEDTVWNDYPMVGWVLNAELHEGLAKVGDYQASHLDEDEAEVVEEVLTALRAAAEMGLDLVTVYG
ncbi:hypothetical protein C8A03DRAFT_32972 [Achaetomium macrosporum]|uniref:Uncharacterized protein n=1 Tax=Achaetomium macrosporum TaxID=79813 RepID=A0AAN7CDG0_9PEZI|nr:hypothetical protein C8A03DRAFT_32972 [Achaetomium macrosporum]